MLRNSEILMVHEKNSWVITLYDNGDIFAFTSYKRRNNFGHMLRLEHKIVSWLPKYVKAMIEDARAFYQEGKNVI